MADGPAAQLEKRAVDILDSYQRIAARMYTLDSHSGRRFLRDAAVVGATSAVADQVNAQAMVTWAQFDELRRLTERIPTPDGYDDLDEGDLTALAALLDDDSVRLDAQQIPVHTSEEPVHRTVGLKSFTNGIETDCARLLELCTDADAACGVVADRVSSINTRLAEVVAEAAANGMSGNTVLATLQARHRAGIDAALSDPLTAVRRDQLRDLDQAVGAFATELAGLRQLRTGYPQRLADLRTAITRLAETEREATDSCALAAAKIAKPEVPRVSAVSAALSSALVAAQHIAGESDWYALAGRLSELDDQVAQAMERCRQCTQTATALLERRSELRGRFAAYSRKAARVGVIENPAVSAALHSTRDLLSIAPCDLPAATAALHRFQQAISQ